jgi:quinol-cytochrome oxidoreductase complex cytochrome b subunit
MVRYLVLVILNLPVLLLAFINLLAQYKLKKISRRKFVIQFLAWLIIAIVIIAAFPIYNWLSDKPAFEAYNLSSFDIIQTTVVIYMLYILNRQRQKIDRNEKTIRELHQRLSIRLSKK